MRRYRVHIVPRTGRFAPLLTVLVDADSSDQAFQLAEVRCAGSKVVSAEEVGGGRAVCNRLRVRCHEEDELGGRWMSAGVSAGTAGAAVLSRR